MMNTNCINKGEENQIENMKRVTVAEDVEVKIGDEVRTIDIVRNENGNLELLNVGSVTYDLFEEELTLS